MKLSVPITLLVMLVCAVASCIAYEAYKEKSVSYYGEVAISISRTVAMALSRDGEQFAQCVQTGEPSAYWLEMSGFMNETRNVTSAVAVFAVGILPNGEYANFFSSFSHPRPGSKRNIADFAPGIIETLQTGRVMVSEDFNVHHSINKIHGNLIAGYAPVYNSKNEIVGAVGVDISTAQAYAAAYGFGIRILLMNTILGLVVAGGIVFYTNRSFSRPIKSITDVILDLAEGKTDIPPLPQRNDEIGLLSNSTRKIAQAIQSLRRLSLVDRNSGEGYLLDVKMLPGKFAEVAEGINRSLTVLDNVNLMVYVIDIETHQIIYSNRRIRSFFHQKEENLNNKKCWEFFTDQPGQPCSFCIMPELVSKKESHSSAEWELYHADTESWLFVRNSVIRWIDGRQVYFTELEDISLRKVHEAKQKQYEEELKKAADMADQASRMKTAFLANMSHEIRTPMNSIIGFSELAGDDELISAQTKNYLDRIKNSAESLFEIINSILDISKVEAGKMELEKIPFCLQEVLRFCEMVCQPKASEKNVMLYFYAEPLVEKKLLGDPTRLRQVLLNLLSNAIKFTNRGMVTLITAVEKMEEDKVTLYFEVRDNGIGMTPEQVSRIYEPFNQADSSTTRRFGGTGLGLPISKSVIELMGGFLDVESIPGVGSKFSFSITLGLTEKPAIAEENLQMVTAPVQKRVFSGNVLVCEDNMMNQMIIREHLERIGFNVIIAENGKEGVEMVKECLASGNPFSLILMDIQMPVMNGLEATALISETSNRAPIIAVTANVMENDREKYLACGMADCLGKPFRAEELVARLSQYLIPVQENVVPAPILPPPEPDPQGGISETAVDREYGLKMAFGDEEFYEKLLKNFVEDNSSAHAELTAALEVADYEKVRRLAHTVKSTSRMIGALALSDVAYAIENTFLADDVRFMPDQLHEFSMELERVLGELETGIDQVGALLVSGSRSRTKNTHELFETLGELIREGRGNSLEYIDDILLEIVPHYEELGRSLISHIQHYDFDLAADVLDQIRALFEGET